MLNWLSWIQQLKTIQKIAWYIYKTILTTDTKVKEGICTLSSTSRVEQTTKMLPSRVMTVKAQHQNIPEAEKTITLHFNFNNSQNDTGKNTTHSNCLKMYDEARWRQWTHRKLEEYLGFLSAREVLRTVIHCLVHP